MNPHIEEDPDDDPSKRSYSPDPTEDPYERFFYGRRKVIRPAPPRSLTEEEAANLRPLSKLGREFIFGPPPRPPPQPGFFRRWRDRLRRPRVLSTVDVPPRVEAAVEPSRSRSARIQQLRTRIADAFRSLRRSRRRQPEPLILTEEERDRATEEDDAQEEPREESALIPPVSKHSRILRLGTRIADAFRRRGRPEVAEDALAILQEEERSFSNAAVERLTAKIEELKRQIDECDTSLNEGITALRRHIRFAASRIYDVGLRNAIQDEIFFITERISVMTQAIRRLQNELRLMEVNVENIEASEAGLNNLEERCSLAESNVASIHSNISSLGTLIGRPIKQ